MEPEVRPRRIPGLPMYQLSKMAKKFPSNPKHPERICWGCDKFCPVGSLACGNGSERTQHPVELFGEDWEEWGMDAAPAADQASAKPSAE